MGEAPYCFHSGYTILQPQTIQEDSLSPHSCEHFSFMTFLITAILTGVRWYLSVVWFAFPCVLVMLSIFSCAFRPSVCRLWKNVYSSSLSNQDFFFECWVVWVLCILNINPLLDISFANIFSPSVGCLFILLMMSFTVQKLFSLISSHLFIFAFASLA